MQRPNPEAVTLSDILITQGLSHAFISNLPGAAVFVVDRDLRYLLAEGEALAIAGFKPEDFVGRTIFEVLPPDLAASYEPLYRQALAGEPFEHEYDAHGHAYISRGTPLRSEDGEVYAVLVVSYDITQRKQSEAALQESEQRYRHLVELTPHLVWNADEQGRNTYVSPQMGRYIGLPIEQLLNLGWETIIHPEDVDRVRCTWMEAVQTGIPYEAEYRLRRADGEYRWHLVRAVFEGNGQGRKWFGVSTDIHERKQAEAALRESEAKLALELADARQLQFISSQLLQEENVDALYEQILEAAIALMRSDMGSMQMLHPDRNELQLLAWKGFDPASAAFWQWVRVDSESTCGMALRTGQRSIVSDVETCELMAGSGDLDSYRRSGVRAVQTTPLICRRGRVVGMISTHWSKPHQPAERELGLLDVLARQAADLIEQRQAEAALRESETKYRSLFNSMDEGYFLCDVIFDENDQPVDLFYVDENPAAIRMTGQSFRGQRLREINPNYEEYWYEIFGRVAQTGQAERLERYAEPDQIWYDFYVFKVGSDDTRQVAVVFNDISERKHRELNVAFLDEIGKELSVLSTPDEIIQTVGKRLCEFLELSGCYFVDIDEAKNEVTVHYGRESEKLPSLMQTFKLEDYLTEDFIHTMRAGEVFLMRDTAQDERAEAENYARLKVASFVTVPFLRNGRYTGHIAVTSEKPRDWRADEIELLQEIASRVFPRIERAHAEIALQESEQKYRTLFDSIDEGLAIVEMIYDDQGEIVDIVFRQVNRAYERQGGVYNVVGRSIFDVIPGVEDYWLDLYKRVAKMGESVREENYQQDVDRWFDVYFSRIDDNGRFVAIVFSDISERKRREAILRENEERQSFLLRLGDILQQFVQPNDIKAAAMRLLGERLGISRAQYHECDSSGEYYIADGIGYANGLPLLDLKYQIDQFGTFVNEDFAAGRPYRIDDLEVSPRVSDEEREAYRTYGIRAGAGVPLIRGGKLVAILAVHDVHPHPWTDLEMDLIRETAERIWTPVERARAQEALRKSETKYRSLFESINDGFALLEVLYDDDHQPIDCRFLEVSPSFETHTTLPQAQGKTLRELIPSVESGWFEHYHQALVTNAPVHFEMYQSQIKIWFEVDVLPYGNPQDRQVAIVFRNINDRKQAEAQLRRAAEMDAFRVKLSDALRPLSDAVEIQRTATRVIGEYLEVDRAYYVDIEPNDEHWVVADNYVREGVPPLIGRGRIDDFGWAGKELLAGRIVCISDVDTDPNLSESARAECRAVDLAAMLAIPLIKEGRWVASFGLQHLTPREWSEAETKLLQETAERTWAAVERAKAEAALRESEKAIAADLANAELLRELAARLVSEENITTIYDEILSTTIAIARADAGTIQIYDPKTKSLELISSKNFSRTITDYFHNVDASSRTACGIAMNTGQRAFVDFPDEVADFGCQLLVHEGVQSALAVPLVSRTGTPLGMLNAHWRETRYRPTDRELRFLDLLARQASDLIEQRQAEAALRASEAKYRSLFTSIDEGFTLLEMISDESGHACDFRIVETNPAWEQQTGLTDAVGKTLLEIAPDFEQQWLDFYSDVVISGRGRRTEYYTASVDRWYTVYASRIGGEESRQVAVVFNNITDRKQRERQQEYLLKLSDTLRPLVEAEEIETSACRVLGEWLGAHRVYYVEIFESEGVGRVSKQYLRDGAASIAGDYPITAFDWTAQPLRRGEAVVVSDVYHSDLVPPEYIAAMEAVQQISIVLVPLIKEGEWVGVLTVGKDAPRDWKEEDVELVRETLERMWAAVQRARAEAALREAELQRVREQSAREQERQRAESLAELDRAKTTFFSNVSHEFRTPLTLSLAPLQDALSDRTHPLDSVHRERLELVHRNSLRLLKLVNTLLDFSRIEAGRMEAVYEPTDLTTYTTELSSVFRSAIERAGLQLMVDCPPLPEPVFVDREMWEKIVLNLLSNAFKFTFEGEIRVSLHSTDRNQAILQIQDTGTGIAPEHLPHLFERFYQVRSTQARTHEGSGIGLALVHELVQLQGGTIEVSSTVGEGTCFTIALPFGTDHLPSDRLHFEGDRYPVRTLASTAMGATAYVEEAERWVPEGNGEASIPVVYSLLSTPPSARVLVVDDNADMREYLTRILSEHVQVEAVADGATALAAAQERVPDLILSDVMMPGLDGFELLQALRADPRTREIPIILLSARAGEEAIVEGLEAGADDYLVKPFSAQELVSRITAHLQTAQQRGEALQEARSTLRSRDEFISVVSHELNTPLVSILGWTRMLRSSPPNPMMLSKALDTIERNATLQGKLVQDLLDLSRITAGKLRLNPQPIELKPVIENAIATVAQTTADKGTELTWQDNISESVVVIGDGDRLSQVLINLLTNAIKFTPESGSVRVGLSVMNDDGSADASYAEIRVVDTGDGIAADFLPYVFDRFRQAQGVNAAKGLGLGLAIARHIVEVHNGTIHAESAGEGQGATFIVRLPLLQKNNDFSGIQPDI